MLNKLKNLKGSSGFTIIEVMIVLAIAGLIMLIVFLAVPALQRNAHNTSIKNDVAAVLAGVNEFTNNNNGKLPDALGHPSNDVVVIGAAADNEVEVKLGYFESDNVSLKDGDTDFPGDQEMLKISKGVECDSATQPVAGSSRSYSVLTQLEGSNETDFCQAS